MRSATSHPSRRPQVVAPVALRAPAPRYAADGDHLRACQQALQATPNLATLTHLLTLLEADLAPAARVALCQALHHHHQGLGQSERALAGAYLDGRFAELLGLMAHWHQPGGVAKLALAHLTEASRPLWRGHVPAAKPGQPAWSPEFVVAWYAEHGVHQAWPVQAGWSVALVWPLLVAQVSALPAFGLDEAQCEPLQSACVALSEQDPTWAPAAWALLFDLAVRQGQWLEAADILAGCAAQGGMRQVRPQALWSWLCPASPESGLSPAAWSALMAAEQWVQPKVQARIRQVCAGTLVEPVWAAFESACAAQEGRVPQREEAGALPVAHQAWRGVLLSQDALAGCEEPGAAQAQRLLPELLQAQSAGLEGACLSVRGQGMLHTRLASLYGALGDAPRAFMAWMQARASDEGVAELAVAGQQAWLRQQASADLDVSWLGGASAHDEQAAWLRLARPDGDAPPDVRAAAQAMLAWQATEGCWSPTWSGRYPDLPQAEAGWHALMASSLQGAAPAWAAWAGQRLQTATFQVCRPLWRQEHGRTHLWREAPGAQRVLIVMACVESHHQFASVPSLVAGMPDHHLLFVHNPELNWYSGAAFEAICELIEAKVGSRFTPDQVTCYFGSMGGYGALKVAARFGFRAVAFNPQIDLDLWAAYRPGQRDQILGAEGRVNLQDVPPKVWAHAPLYLMVGSHTADRAALDLLLRTLSQVPDGNFIVEKFDDSAHAGLIHRASGGQVLRALRAAESRLGALVAMADTAAPGWTAIPAAVQPALWAELSTQCEFKIEVRVRHGQMWVAESQRCGTRMAA